MWIWTGIVDGTNGLFLKLLGMIITSWLCKNIPTILEMHAEVKQDHLK